jgi:hypothetical protein
MPRNLYNDSSSQMLFSTDTMKGLTPITIALTGLAAGFVSASVTPSRRQESDPYVSFYSIDVVQPVCYFSMLYNFDTISHLHREEMVSSLAQTKIAKQVNG